MKKRFITALLAVSFVGTIPIYSVAASNNSSENHEHTFACHEAYSLVCKEDHCHEESCYECDGDLICGLEEGTPHTHNENGYECELVDKILICEQEEHTHGSECYDEEERPFGKEELPETGFTEEFYSEEELPSSTEGLFDAKTEDLPSNTVEVLVCDKEEHEHSASCYKEVWQCRKVADESQIGEDVSEYEDEFEEDSDLPEVISFENIPEVDNSAPEKPEDSKPAPEDMASADEQIEAQEAVLDEPPISQQIEVEPEVATGEYAEISTPEDWESFIPSDVSIPQQKTTTRRMKARSAVGSADTANNMAMFAIKQSFLTFADYTVPMTTAYRIDAIMNGELIYSDVFAITADSYDEEYISIAQGIPEGAEVRISLLYSGASYSLYTGHSDQIVWNGVQGGTNNLATFSLVYNFDNQLGYGIENNFEIEAISLPDPGPTTELPETGSSGVGLMAFCGSFFTCLGGTFVYVRRKVEKKKRRRL